MRVRVLVWIMMVGLMPGLVLAEGKPCEGSPKGTSQTPAGMCIDGVLFKDVLKRLTEIEAKLAAISSTLPQGKQGH